MDQLFCMRVFTRVVELRSFARASEALEVSRPTATTAVARLEKRLGVRLLQRTTRRLSLTEDGRAYYEGCVRILRELAETEDALSSTRTSPRGRLRVSIPHSFNHLAFMPALPKFLERYPGLEVEIVMTDRAVNMVEEGIDCAVRAVVDIPGDSTLVARHVAGCAGSPALRRATCASTACRVPSPSSNGIIACASFPNPAGGSSTGASRKGRNARATRRAATSR